MRLCLVAILCAGALVAGFVGVDAVASHIYARGVSDGERVRDALRDEVIDELLEGWGKCEMEKPGHIIFPSDTAVRNL